MSTTTQGEPTTKAPDRPPRRLPVMAFLVVAGISWWLWQLYRASNRVDLSTYWQLVVTVAGAGLALAPLVKDWLANRAVGERDRSKMDRLAEAVEKQWTKAAESRRLLLHNPIAVRWTKPENPMAASAKDATESTRFKPLPKMAPTTQEQLNQGGLGDLHAVYGGLRSGRLVIAGAPGSGKSAAAVLLLLDALRHRESVRKAVDRDGIPLPVGEVPVPVLFTLHGWNPNTQPVRDWLVAQLRQTYDNLFTGRRGARKAAEFIDDGKITVILDGLDEIPKMLQHLALRALSEQATFRLVVLSRSAEMTDAAEHAILEESVAVELRDVDPKTAANYLTRIQRNPLPPRWRELIELLDNDPDCPITRALSNPLTLTLIRDTYREGDDIGELLDFCANTEHETSRDAVEDHLSDRLLRTAYSTPLGDPHPPRYSLDTAQHTLQLIAARMSKDNTRDLALGKVAFPQPDRGKATLPRQQRGRWSGVRGWG